MKYCRKCGAEMPDKALVCAKCGTPVKPGQDSASQKAEEKRGWRQTGEEEAPAAKPAERPAEEYAEEPLQRWVEEPMEPAGQRTYMPENTAAGSISRYSTLSFYLGLAAIPALMIPFLSLVLSVMAILFGIIGLRAGEALKKRAVTGIVVGVVFFLVSATLIFCIVLLAPYANDLTRIFQAYMQP